jgi:predicted AlkP superfamily phosphohydrolase/phosphomutase
MTASLPVTPARLVVLGIDAAAPELLDAWIADGSLPNLAALAARGVTARTRGVEGFFIGSTWPSMYTGTTPAQHGVHYLLELVPGSYELRDAAHAAFVRRPPFWRALSDAGRRVAILDVPLTRLDAGLDGIQVIEWGGHDSVYGFHASSPTLAQSIVQRYGTHPTAGPCDAIRRTPADYAAFVERLEHGASRKAAWTCELLQQGGWDLFMQVFTEGHCAGHQCWHLHDTRHPAHDPAVVAAIGDPLQRAYRAIDRAIGDVVSAAGDAPVVVFSAHGMSHWYGAQFLLQEILVRLGAVAPGARSTPRPNALRDVARGVWRALPEPVRAPIRALRASLAPPPARQRPAIDADLARTRCFVHPNGLAVGGIRLNLVGREPSGVLHPGAEAEAFVDWLEDALLGIVDERSGGPLVRRVMRTASWYEGEHRAILPDLLVEWSDDVPTGARTVSGGVGARVRVSSPLIGTLEGENEFGRTGEHRPGGWLLAAIPGLAPGRLVEQPALVDLAPTLAAMLGVTLDGVDGRPIATLVSAATGRAGR